MSAAVYQRPGEVRIEERPVPPPGPGQVLVEVGHCGICGSDIHMIVDGWGKPGVVEGHEWTGVVAAVGPDVDGLGAGRRGRRRPAPRCGRCRRCLEGQPSQCEDRGRSMTDDLAVDGAFADYILVDSRSLLRPAPTASIARAPRRWPNRSPSRSTASPAARSADGDSVMVLGAGPIGALSVAALVARGLGPVTVVEPGAARQELARTLGADSVIHPDELEVFPQWEPERDGRPRPSTWCSSARARRRRWRPGSTSSRGAAGW